MDDGATDQGGQAATHDCGMSTRHACSAAANGGVPGTCVGTASSRCSIQARLYQQLTRMLRQPALLDLPCVHSTQPLMPAVGMLPRTAPRRPVRARHQHLFVHTMPCPAPPMRDGLNRTACSAGSALCQPVPAGVHYVCTTLGGWTASPLRRHL